MFENLAIYPLSFWVVIGLLVGGGLWAKGQAANGTGLPMLAVLGTVATWYVGDAFYNDYAHNHVKLFTQGILDDAWWEVACFLVVFLVATPCVHQRINARYLKSGSGVMHMAKFGIGFPVFQQQLELLFKACFIVWLLLAVVATMRLGTEIPHYFFPFLGYKAEPWGRGRMGSGFDALLTLAFYFQMMVASTFGVVAAVATNRRIRTLAILLCLVAWPYFVFDRTRNTMLSVVIPAVLSFVFLGLRGGAVKKILVLAGCFLVVNGWMSFVIANRSDMSMAQALDDKGFSIKSMEKTHHHEGLNMFEELCWINTFIQKGIYNPNWGARYFAEMVNPIPRVLWPGKPMIGIDYAIARGQGTGGGGNQAGVNATVSTGLIGQGVVNFGGILGPAAAALLMSLWAACLARQDLQITEVGRLPLYACGLILTFNLGRDFTLITLYPFIFGELALWWFKKFRPDLLKLPGNQSGQSVARTPNPPSPRSQNSQRRPVGFRRTGPLKSPRPIKKLNRQLPFK